MQFGTFVIYVLPIFGHFLEINAVNYQILNLDNCVTSDETVFSIGNCEVSPSRINITVDIKKPLNKFFVLISLFIKQDDEYKQLFKAPRFEWCSLMAGTKNNNRLLRGLVEALKSKVPQLFQKCPYSGHYELINVTLNKKMLAIYPSGTFKSKHL